MNQLSHVNKSGEAHMVDVGDKSPLKRTAKATGFISLEPNTLLLIHDNQLKKGDVITVAKIAGIQAAKQTPSLIPLCHNLLINQIEIDCRIVEKGIEVDATVKCTGNTGVEMEALTAVSIALLTIYDMCKAVDKNMVIMGVKLLSKRKE